MSHQGWECPKCGKVLAPWMQECAHGPALPPGTTVIPVTYIPPVFPTYSRDLLQPSSSASAPVDDGLRLFLHAD